MLRAVCRRKRGRLPQLGAAFGRSELGQKSKGLRAWSGYMALRGTVRLGRPYVLPLLPPNLVLAGAVVAPPVESHSSYGAGRSANTHKCCEHEPWPSVATLRKQRPAKEYQPVSLASSRT